MSQSSETLIKEILKGNEVAMELLVKKNYNMVQCFASLSRNRIVILSTHIVSDIEFLANEIVVMKVGKLVEKNTPSKLIEKIRGKVWI